MQPDAVIIGSGPNGLVAANVLADRGWEALVVEAAASPGGAVRSAELIEPGFVNDLFSVSIRWPPRRPCWRTLTWIATVSVGATLRWFSHIPTVDGTCPVLSRDIDETAASLDEHHPGDGAAWRRIMRRWDQVGRPLLDAMMSPFPPVRAGVRLARSLPVSEWSRFARYVLLPIRRMAEEEFRSEQARRLLAGLALHSDLGPEATLSGLFGWLLGCLGQTVGFPVPAGGSGALSSALVRRLESLGGSVLCDAPVDEIVVRRGRAVAVHLVDGRDVSADRAVLADVSAPALYGRMVRPEHLPADLLDDLSRFEWDNATVKIDWTLDAPIAWRAEAARRAGTVHVAEGIDALTVFAAELVRGLVPARPYLLVGQQSMTDPSRQPSGRETAWAYTHVPREIRGDSPRRDQRPLGRSRRGRDDPAARSRDGASGTGVRIDHPRAARLHPTGARGSRREPQPRSDQRRHRAASPTARLPAGTGARPGRDAGGGPVPRVSVGPSRRSGARGGRCERGARRDRGRPPASSDEAAAIGQGGAVDGRLTGSGHGWAHDRRSGGAGAIPGPRSHGGGEPRRRGSRTTAEGRSTRQCWHHPTTDWG